MTATSAEARKEIDSIDVMTPRIKALLDCFYNSPVQLCPERSRLATLSWKETEGEPLHIRRAKLFAKICDELPIAIFDNELIVGSQTHFVRGVGVQLDFNPKVGFEIEEGDRRLRAERSTGRLSEEGLRMIVEDAHYWKGKSPGDIMLRQVREVMGSSFEDISDSFSKSYGTFTFYAPMADYAKILRLGLKGIIAEIDGEISNLKFSSIEDSKKLQFLQAAKICCQAEIRLAKRFGDLARRMASREGDTQRRSELGTIADVCEHVPENPARGFWEALQCVRFIHLGLYLEDGQGSGANLGRADQYLFPFYKSDLDQGKLTRSKAAELFAALWVKVAASEAIVPAVTKLSGSGYIESRVILGGVDRGGKDVCNELTRLILHMAGQMKMDVPLYLRWHHGIDRDLVLKAVWTNMQIGSEPALHNDDQTIPGLVADGASLEDARDYVLQTCAHPYPFGSARGIQHFMNGGKVLELVMNNGVDPRTGKQLGLKTGDPRKFATIGDWVDAFLKQWEYTYDVILKGYNIGESTQATVYSQPFASALNADCIQKGLDVHEGGSRYNQFTAGINNKVYADVPDSLMAINEVVYRKRKITIEELLSACAHNFEGSDGEHIRDLLLSAPKYGNDSGEPEEMYRLLNDRIEKIARSRRGYFGYPMRDVRLGGAVFSGQGRITGALPNGRKAGVPLADGGISPGAGCDTRGPTVTLRSVGKAIDFGANRSAVLNQKIPRSLLTTKEHIDRFVDLTETYFADYNGYDVQWNIENKDVYLAAKANPSAYKNLIVRIGGYSAYFIELDPLVQDQIIARTEQFV